MIIKKSETITKESNCGFICDKCKKEFLNEKLINAWQNAGKLELDGGYGSRFDLSLITLHLCDDCFEDTYEFVTGGKIKPESPHVQRSSGWGF